MKIGHAPKADFKSRPDPNFPYCKTSSKKIFTLCLLVFVIIFPGKPQAETIDLEGDPLKAINNAKSVNLKAVLAEPGLLAFMYINTDRTRLVTVTEKPQKGQVPLRRLTFYRSIGRSFIPTYEYVTINRFAHVVYPTLDETRLITVWGTGSAYRLTIFAVGDAKVTAVLHVGWKQEPEFVDLAGTGEAEIFVPEGYVPGKEPEWAEVYSWDGTKYVQARRVPWAQRFVPASKSQ